MQAALNDKEPEIVGYYIDYHNLLVKAMENNNHKMAQMLMSFRATIPPSDNPHTTELLALQRKPMRVEPNSDIFNSYICKLQNIRKKYQPSNCARQAGKFLAEINQPYASLIAESIVEPSAPPL